jgi:hypothetical protein
MKSKPLFQESTYKNRKSIRNYPSVALSAPKYTKIIENYNP